MDRLIKEKDILEKIVLDIKSKINIIKSKTTLNEKEKDQELKEVGNYQHFEKRINFFKSLIEKIDLTENKLKKEKEKLEIKLNELDIKLKSVKEDNNKIIDFCLKNVDMIDKI